MKRLLTFCLIALVVLLSQRSVDAGEYLTYQEINTRAGVMLLREYSRSDYNTFYERVSRRRFWGWRTFTVFKNEPVTFQKDTLFVISNDGQTPITQSFTFRTSEQEHAQISSSGNIGISASGNVRGFQLGLDSQIERIVTRSHQRTIEEEVEINISIDPQTTLQVEIYGEGLLSNGVAKYYRFWMNRRTGGWEVFVVTTEYLSIVKAPLANPR